MQPCHYCGTSLHRGVWTWDHVVPRDAGGPDREANLVLACRRCNRLKAAKRSPCTCSRCLSAWRRFGPVGWGLIAVAEMPAIGCRWPWGSLVLSVSGAGSPS